MSYFRRAVTTGAACLRNLHSLRQHRPVLSSFPLSAPSPLSRHLFAPSPFPSFAPARRFHDVTPVPSLALNDLRPNPGAKKKKKRVGRGRGGGRGGTSTRGHGGQGQRGSIKVGFEGGQTPLFRRLPKKGKLRNGHGSIYYETVNLEKIQSFVDQGRIDASVPVTMRVLHDVGICKTIKDGVKLLAKNGDALKTPLHFVVSRSSVGAAKAILRTGGSLTLAHYNRLGIRVLLKREKWERERRAIPRHARPPPKMAPNFPETDDNGLPIRRITKPEDVLLVRARAVIE